jgi:transposase
VFVKKAQRVEALALVMALTLMVYTLAERKLRQTLAARQQTVLDPKKRPTAKPHLPMGHAEVSGHSSGAG